MKLVYIEDKPTTTELNTTNPFNSLLPSETLEIDKNCFDSIDVNILAKAIETSNALSNQTEKCLVETEKKCLEFKEKCRGNEKKCMENNKKCIEKSKIKSTDNSFDTNDETNKEHPSLISPTLSVPIFRGDNTKNSSTPEKFENQDKQISPMGDDTIGSISDAESSENEENVNNPKIVAYAKIIMGSGN